jgi:uncharacterized RDD family membrane protein YckC
MEGWAAREVGHQTVAMERSDAMKCTNCGAEVGAGHKFCTSCGTPVGMSRCASCGAEMGAGEQFCTTCGARQGAAAESSDGPVAPAISPRPVDSAPPPAPVRPEKESGTTAAPVDYKGVVPRLLAAIIDAVLFVALYVFLVSRFGTAATTAARGQFELGFNLDSVGAAIFCAVGAAYFLLMEGFLSGTIGKLVLGMRVVNGRGRAPGLVPALVRNVVWIIDFLPIFFLLGILLMVTSKHKQRLGDRFAGTFVVSRATARAMRASGDEIKGSSALLPVILLLVILAGAAYLYVTGGLPIGPLTR